MKKYYIFLISALALCLSLSFKSKGKFHFKNGAYRIWVKDTELHDIGISDYIYDQNGYYFSADIDSVEHHNCHESREKFTWKLDRNKNQLILNNYDVWHKDTCGQALTKGEAYAQYFEIIFQSKDSLVTKLAMDVYPTETHKYTDNQDLYIWVWESKLTHDQKKLVK